MFRAISGFGDSGKTHSSTLLDVSFDLPVVIEFFDEDKKVQSVIQAVKDIDSQCHILTFDAKLS